MKYNKISSFIIKIVAMVTMVFDHLGYMMMNYSINDTLAFVFRCIGRLSLPLFIFMLVEGVLHTKSFSKYCLRLGIMATVILVAQIIIEYGMKYTIYQGNIFLDLLLGAFMVKVLMNKDVHIKLLALIPLGIGLTAFMFYLYDPIHPEVTKFFPYFLRPQYHLYSMILTLGFYEAYEIAKYGFSVLHMDYELYKDSPTERIFVNSIQVGMLIVCTTFMYVLGLILVNNNNLPAPFWTYSIQNYAMISGALILLYSGKRGYNAKWFQYGSYLFYPVHLLILYIVFELIFTA